MLKLSPTRSHVSNRLLVCVLRGCHFFSFLAPSKRRVLRASGFGQGRVPRPYGALVWLVGFIPPGVEFGMRPSLSTENIVFVYANRKGSTNRPLDRQRSRVLKNRMDCRRLWCGSCWCRVVTSGPLGYPFLFWSSCLPLFLLFLWTAAASYR